MLKIAVGRVALAEALVFRGGGGRGINIPMGGGRGGFSISTLVMLVIIYFAVKFFLGIDLLEVINGGGVQVPGGGTTPK